MFLKILFNIFLVCITGGWWLVFLVIWALLKVIGKK